jgi:integrase
MAANPGGGDQLVFGNYRYREPFERARDAAGLDRDVVFHSLRHTYISRLVMAGVDLRTVQELAGHKTIQMTIRYAHLAPEHKRRAVERMEETQLCEKVTAKVTTVPGLQTGRIAVSTSR